VSADDGRVTSEDAAVDSAGLRRGGGKHGVRDRSEARATGKGCKGKRCSEGEQRRTTGTATERERGLHEELQIFKGE
jgi:hypothetical protein